MIARRHSLASALALGTALAAPASAQSIIFEDLPQDRQQEFANFAATCTDGETIGIALSEIDCAAMQEIAATGVLPDPEIAEASDPAPQTAADPDGAEAVAVSPEVSADEADAAIAQGGTAEADPGAETQGVTTEAAESAAAETVDAEAPALAETGDAAMTDAADTEEPAQAFAADGGTAVAPEPAPEEGTDAMAGTDAADTQDGLAPEDGDAPLVPGEGPSVDEAGEALREEAQDAGSAVADGLDAALTPDADPNIDAVADALRDDAAAAEAAEVTADTDAAGASSANVVEVAPIDSQTQADRLAEQDNAAAAAAAASTEVDGAELVEETVSADDIRASSEDFSTDANALAETESGDGDDEARRNRRNAALIGLGAIALQQILGANDRVVSDSGDRVVIENEGQLRVLRNDDVLLRRPGADVQTYRFDDGSTRTVVTYEDGSEVETVRTAEGRVLRRTRVLPSGESVVLFDDTQATEQVVVNELPQTTERRRTNFRDVESDDLAAALAAAEAVPLDRSFSLNQIRNIDAVRQLVPEITVDTINFETASAAIRPEEAEELASLGNLMARVIEDNPGEVFLIEGHTDAVGAAGYNLALSDRRAESVALALTEYFGVPPENMVLQGYGESDLLIPTAEAERQNRRAAVRRITPLLQAASR